MPFSLFIAPQHLRCGVLQQVVKQIHAFCFLLYVGAAVDIEREGHVLVSENFRKRLDIEFRDFDCSNGKGVPDLVKLHLLQTVSLDKAREELTIRSRLGRLALAGQEVVRRVVRIKLLNDVAKERRYRYDSRRCFRFRGADVKICSSFLLVVNSLHRLVDVDRLTFE